MGASWWIYSAGIIKYTLQSRWHNTSSENLGSASVFRDVRVVILLFNNIATNAIAFSNTYGITYPSVMDVEDGSLQLAFSGSIPPNAVLALMDDGPARDLLVALAPATAVVAERTPTEAATPRPARRPTPYKRTVVTHDRPAETTPEDAVIAAELLVGEADRARDAVPRAPLEVPLRLMDIMDAYHARNGTAGAGRRASSVNRYNPCPLWHP